MKSIPNVTFEVKDQEGKNLTTATLLKMCLRSERQGGFTIDTVKVHLKVEAVLDKAVDGGIIELEDEYHRASVQAIKDTRWLSYGPHLVKFAEQFGL